MTHLYDDIGRGYRRYRRPDPRISRAIVEALGDAVCVVNVGAGSGSYEPRDGRVVAVEPSATMIRQRPPGSAPAVRADGARLPFADGAFDASLAILTLHHWSDQASGLREMRRIARGRVVIVTWDPASPGFWLADYFPEILDIDRRIFPPLVQVKEGLGDADIAVLPIPHDCTDGFLGAYWNRPAAYLDAGVRSAISTFTKLESIDEGLRRLGRDLASGEWGRRYGARTRGDACDLGYRLIVAT